MRENNTLVPAETKRPTPSLRAESPDAVALAYLVSSSFFLLAGFALILISPQRADLGIIHGTIMIFLGVIPFALGALGNALVPRQIGASGLWSLKLAWLAFVIYSLGGLCLLYSLFRDADGNRWWLGATLLLVIAAQTNGWNLLMTTALGRCPGLSWSRLPLFTWAVFISSALMLFAFPPLQLATWGEFSGYSRAPLLWFLAHPEVYVLVLPALGIASEILGAWPRRTLLGYEALVGSLIFLGTMGFLVWGHQLFFNALTHSLSSFFQVTVLILAVPSAVALTIFGVRLAKAPRPRSTAVGFAAAFFPMFLIGNLSGLPLGLLSSGSEIPLKETYYVVGHFHYFVAPGTLFALMGALYHWFPLYFGRALDERLGRLHFWLTFVASNAFLLPMLWIGWQGTLKGTAIPPGFAKDLMRAAEFLLASAQVPLLYNLLTSCRRTGSPLQNPWSATTLEWRDQPSPTVYRRPYQYDEAGKAGLQWVPPKDC